MSNQIVSNSRALNIENVINALITENYLNQLISHGRVYTVNQYFPSVADGAAVNLLVRPANGEQLHIRFQGSCGGNALMELIEAPTVELSGTVVTPINKNRVNGFTTNVTTSSGATVTAATGLVLVQDFVPGGTGGQAVGGVLSSFGEEFILKDATDYLLRITNKSGQTNPCHLNLTFYSEDAV